MSKNWKIWRLKEFKFFKIKIAVFSGLTVFMKDSNFSWSLQLSRENIQLFETRNFFFLSFLYIIFAYLAPEPVPDSGFTGLTEPGFSKPEILAKVSYTSSHLIHRYISCNRVKDTDPDKSGTFWHGRISRLIFPDPDSVGWEKNLYTYNFVTFWSGSGMTWTGRSGSGGNHSILPVKNSPLVAEK